MSPVVERPSVVNLEGFPHQMALIESGVFIFGFVGGVGSGKTYGLGLAAMNWQKTKSPKSPVLVAAPTHEQLDKATLATLKEIWNECGIEYVHGCRPPKSWDVPAARVIKRWDNVLTCETGHIFVGYSLDDPQNIRGIQFGLALVDELFQCKDNQALTVIIGRMRCPHTDEHFIRFATTPPRIGGPQWGYYWFYNPKTKAEESDYIQVHQSANTKLPDHYGKRMKSTYDPVMYRIEVEGEFVLGVQGRLYSDFSEEHVVPWKYDPNLDIHVGCDFNTAPMAWCVSQVDPQTQEIHVFDEIFIEMDATTEDACALVKSKYPKHNIYVYPDASCKRVTSSSKGTQGDYTILQRHGFSVELPSGKNPFIHERVESVQKRFREMTLFIDPRCENLLHSLFHTEPIPGMRKPAKSKTPGAIGEHPTDALGYLVYNMDFRGRVHFLAY